MNIISFDKSVKTEILSIFDKTIDKDGYIVEMNDPAQRVVTPEGATIHIDEFSGLYKGSEILVKSDVISLLEIADRMK